MWKKIVGFLLLRKRGVAVQLECGISRISITQKNNYNEELGKFCFKSFRGKRRRGYKFGKTTASGPV